MTINKIKAFLIIFAVVEVCLIIFKISVNGFYFPDGFILGTVFYGFFVALWLHIFGIQKPIISYFDKKSYAEQDEINFQTNLRREIQRKKALSEIDNENLHYQNQLRIEYIAKVAQIHLQSNQYLADMYQKAIISNSTNNELTAQKQLRELEEELKKQGLI